MILATWEVYNPPIKILYSPFNRPFCMRIWEVQGRLGVSVSEGFLGEYVGVTQTLCVGVLFPNNGESTKKNGRLMETGCLYGSSRDLATAIIQLCTVAIFAS